MKTSHFLPAAAVLLLMGTFQAGATPIPVPNSNFSDTDISGTNPSPGGVGYTQTTTSGDDTAVPDWTTGTDNTNPGHYQSWGLIDNDTYSQYASLPDSGTNFAYENVIDATDTLTSTLTGADFVSGDTYNLSVEAGGNSGNSYDGTYFVELLDNGVEVASGTLDGSTITGGTFATLSLSTPFVAADNGAIGVLIGFTTTETSNQQANFSDVCSSRTRLLPSPSLRRWRCFLAAWSARPSLSAAVSLRQLLVSKKKEHPPARMLFSFFGCCPP